MLAPRRCPTKLDSAKPQPISRIRSLALTGLSAMRSANFEPEGQSNPNSDQKAEEIPSVNAASSGS